MATLGFSILGTMRLNRNRLNYYRPTAYVYINGALQPSVRLSQITIREVVNSTPNSASLRIKDYVPVEGNDIKIYGGTTAPGSLLFGGTVRSFTQIAEQKRANVAYDLNCNDYTTLLDRHLVYGTFTGVSASVIVSSIMVSFTSGFTLSGVEPNLPARSFSWVGVEVSQVLTEIAQSVAAKWKISYTRDLKFGTTATVFPTPDTVTASSTFLADLTSSRDISQVRTRVYVEYKGSNVLAPVTASFPTVPIQDATTFDSAGGTFVTTYGDRATYTGKSTNDGLGSTVTGAVYGPQAPFATVSTTLVGGLVGVYSYKVSFVLGDGAGNSLGESDLSVASNTVTGTSVSTPTTPSAAVRSGGPAEITSITRSGAVATVTLAVVSARYSPGDRITISGLAQPEYNGVFAITAISGTFTFQYAVVGTPASPATTTGGASPPYPSGTAKAFVDVSGNVGGSNLTTQVSYVVTYVTSSGESLISATAGPLTISPVSVAGAGVANQTSGVNGGLTNGSYLYRAAYLTSSGETFIATTPDFTGGSLIQAVSSPGSLGIAVSGPAGNISNGSFSYYVSFVTATGETAVGGPFNPSSSPPAVTAPGSPTVGTTSGVSGSLTTGSYGYKISFVTATGETLPGATGSTSVSAVTPPSASGMSSAIVSFTPGAVLFGSYTYSLTFRTASGETVGATGSPPSSTISQISNSASGITITSITMTGGNLGGMSLNYLISDVDQFGETLGASTGTVTMGANNANNVAITASSDSRTIGRKLYRRNNADGLGYLLVFSTITGRGSVSYLDNQPDISRIAENPPAANTTGNGQISLTSIPTSADSRVTSRVLYRKLGGGSYKQLAVIGDNSTTTFIDNIPESQITPIPIPGSDSTGFAQISLTGIPTSGDSRVVGRAIYRTKAGGSTYFALSRIGDNSTTTFTDNTPDTSLGAGTPPLTTTTADNGQMALSSIPTSADGRVTGRSIYRSKNGTTSPAYLVTTINDNFTTTYTDNTPDTSLGVAAPTVSKANTGQMSLTSIPVSSDHRVVGRVLYRTKVGGSIFFRLAVISDNIVTIYSDTVPDASLTDVASTIDSSGGAQVRVTIPVSGDPRVTARRIYRLPAGGNYQAAGTIGDNTTTLFIDNTADSSLGDPLILPNVYTAGGSAVNLTAIPTGPTNTTARRIYRTLAGTTVYQLAGTVPDNTTTVYTDQKADIDLGDVAPANSTILTAAGSITIGVVELSSFSSTGGWVSSGSQIISYSGKSASSGSGTLTGIPEARVGSIASNIRAGSDIINVPYLTGVSGIIVAPQVGDTIRPYVQGDDTAAQTVMAAKEGGDGIHEFKILDETIVTKVAAMAAYAAEFSLFSSPEQKATLKTRDYKVIPGAQLPINLGSPTSMIYTLPVSAVVISDIGSVTPPVRYPLRTVELSTSYFTLQDLIRRISLDG